MIKLNSDQRHLQNLYYMIPISALFLFLLFHRSYCDQMPIYRHQKTITYTENDGISCQQPGSNNDTQLGFGNCFDNIYYINLNLGTPSQEVAVQFDTGSNILWIPTVQGTNHGFNTSASSTYKISSNPGSVTYVDGSGVYGDYGTDRLEMEDTPIDITASILWVNRQVSMHYPSPIQGLVGMGYTKTPNFLDISYNLNQIETSTFALQIRDNSEQSIVHFNQIPESITNSTIMVDVISGSYYWAVDILSVTVGGVDMTYTAAGDAVIDSGTSYFYLNPSLYNSVVQRFFSSCNLNKSPPRCSCSDVKSWPKFEFMFKGVEVYIEPIEYAAVYSNFPLVCTFNFGPISGISQILLGDIFFRSYTITFSKLNSQIGFSGNITPIQSVDDGYKITNYVMIGLLGCLIIFGLITLFYVQYKDYDERMILNQEKSVKQAFELPQSANYQPPQNYNINS